MRICSIQGCGRKHYGRGYCNPHYHRWLSSGDPLGTGKAIRGSGLAFIEKALAHHSDECLLWPYGKGRDGYALCWIDGALARVHAVICERVHGPKPPDKDHAAHNCGVRHCINGRHVRWATHAENMQDKKMHGTNWHYRGEAHPNAKLTEEAVAEIRRLEGQVARKELGRRFGVHPTMITRIHRNEAWVK